MSEVLSLGTGVIILFTVDNLCCSTYKVGNLLIPTANCDSGDILEWTLFSLTNFFLQYYLK